MYTVHLVASHAYDILIGPNLLEKAGQYIRNVFSPCKVCVVTDSNVHPLYANQVMESLTSASFTPIEYVFPAGEQHKTLETLSLILEFMAENQMTRGDIVAALGGGVTGDIAGFAAAVYARGIPFVQLPTTLLAAVDSSVGGKTAVDLKAGKNLAGAFHQPSLVLTDTNVMAELPEKLLSEGAAEIIKYGVLMDEALFQRMSASGWKRHLPEIILRSVEIKKEMVMADEFDTGMRKLLNLGHTFGHAIEKCADFSISHGEGVAIGMTIAAGATGNAALTAEIIKANLACNLPFYTEFDARALSQAALTDKKRSGMTVDLILPECIGKCNICPTPVEALPGLFEKGLSLIKELT